MTKAVNISKKDTEYISLFIYSNQVELSFMKQGNINKYKKQISSPSKA